ncbi:MAG: DNA-methyltransferase [Pontimonas sp.]
MRLINADCLEALKALPDCSIDAVVTDPPYGLNAMKSKDVAECLAAWASGETWEPRGRGFMGKSWDAWVPPPELWREVHRVLKPGGHALVFAGSRTQDLMSVALRLAGFEVRDTVQWLYGSGFPKSLDVSKALKDHPQAREWEGWGTALKPAYEPAILVRKELDGTVANNVLEHGVGGLNIDGCRIDAPGRVQRQGVQREYGVTSIGGKTRGKVYVGGRYPSNVILDEPASASLTEQAGDVSRFFYTSKASKKEREAGLDATGGQRANVHPTVKPIDLMRYLCRLITPPNGTVLDPFMGSGSTGCAAALEGFDFVGIEREAEYFEIAQRRIEHWRNEAKNAEPKQGRLL